MSLEDVKTETIPGDYQFKATYHGPISQRLWHLRKHDLLEFYLKNQNFSLICDAGCGSGVIAAKVSSLASNSKVFAYDINEESIKFAKNQYQQTNNLFFVRKDLLDKKQVEKIKFDFIYSFEVIEHFTKEEVNQYLCNLFRMGHQKTCYLLTTPDYLTMWYFIEWVMDNFSLAPKLADHQHLTKFTKDKLVNTISKNGFYIKKISNFCGISPFVAHISRNLSDRVYNLEKRMQWGNLLFCEFEKK
jgi:2-polyprenyl-3-methyl-5-hydroxy-6-metoxy-1,4-benzoquinol methylase